ncbi:acylphosphatase [Leptothermofonsia sp. ETS-13]|uniref:acylphosphatase n=1 Tax=Leptothermofonsia sp. ETS-13 TaxID=3035696 RepID=UPI003BA3C2BB
MELIRAHAFISGIVQGVGYRFTTQNVALQLGVRGWVRNLPDGRVEAVFEGPRESVKEMIRWCHQGPRGAIVDEVGVEYEAPEGLKRFEIRR